MTENLCLIMRADQFVVILSEYETPLHLTPTQICPQCSPNSKPRMLTRTTPYPQFAFAHGGQHIVSLCNHLMFNVCELDIANATFVAAGCATFVADDCHFLAVCATYMAQKCLKDRRGHS